jgi:hypothetical protein
MHATVAQGQEVRESGIPQRLHATRSRRISATACRLQLGRAIFVPSSSCSSAVNGQPMTLSGMLTTDDPSANTPLAGKSVTFTLGSGGDGDRCERVGGAQLDG